MSGDRTAYYKEILIPIIEKYLPVCAVYLFGSRARGTNREGADIDIALDAGGPIAYETIVAIRNDIDDSRIPVFVDVVDVHAASDHMKQQIKKDGVIWKT